MTTPTSSSDCYAEARAALARFNDPDDLAEMEIQGQIVDALRALITPPATRRMSDRTEYARGVLERVEQRLRLPRLGASTWREMDRDLIILREARDALKALIAVAVEPSLSAWLRENDLALVHPGHGHNELDMPLSQASLERLDAAYVIGRR